MERTAKSLEMANFVCKFGERNLMDFFKEIVEPAFFTSRKYKLGQSRFFFNDVELLTLDGGDDEADEFVVAIAGRFIRDIKLTREQYFDSKAQKMIEDQDSLDSSPSALFVLILNNHRLLYLKETKHAPTLDMFKRTIHRFLKDYTKDYLGGLAKDEKNSFIKDIGYPELTITPLTSEESLENFIRSYSKLEQVRIIVNKRNDEIDNESFIRALQKQGEEAHSNYTEITHKNTQKGLDKEKVIEQAAAATKYGNQTIELKGVTDTGEVLKGNNENFKIVTKISNVTKSVSRAAKKMYNSFKTSKENGLINVPRTTKTVKKQLENIILKGDERNEVE